MDLVSESNLPRIAGGARSAVDSPAQANRIQTPEVAMERSISNVGIGVVIEGLLLQSS